MGDPLLQKATESRHEYTCTITQFNSSYSTSAIPGDLISSILRIIFTSCVARLICCFLASNVSITCCERMSGGCEGEGAEEEREGGSGVREGSQGGKGGREGVREGSQGGKGGREEGGRRGRGV